MSAPGPPDLPAPLTGRDALLLDLDGVVYAGSRALPGAVDAVSRARGDDLPVRFVTNNASRTPEAVAAKLRRVGVAAGADEVVTSAQVAAELLAARLGRGAGPVAVVGGAGLHEALTAAGLRPVPAVDVESVPAAVVQGFDPSTGWADLAAAARWLQAGAPWLATNLDLTIPLEAATAPGNGALVRAVATAVGRDPDDVAGKPSAAPFTRAARQCGSRAPLVVGDRLDTDVAGGRAAGALTALVLTGVHGVADVVAAPPHQRPDVVVPTLGHLWSATPPLVTSPAGRGRRAAAGSAASSGRVSVRWTAEAGLGLIVDGAAAPPAVAVEKLAGDDGGLAGLLEAARAVVAVAHDVVDAAAPADDLALALALADDPVVLALADGLRAASG